jgi:site-specific recombinase XerD
MMELLLVLSLEVHMSIQLSELIDVAVACLEKYSLSEGTIKDYRQAAFRPLERRLAGRGYVDSELLRSQENFFFQQFEDGTLSRHTLNWRIRGIRMLMEILDTGGFTWKVFSKKQKESLTEPFRLVLDSFMQTQNCGQKHKDCINSICRRFLLYVSGNGGTDVGSISSEHVRSFVVEISKSRPKSMDDVVYALRAFFRYLCENGLYSENFWMLLAAPRCRDHRVRECVSPEEVSRLLESIDRETDGGKRDFAAMSMAAVSGLRAGDIASLKLDDIDWKKKEIRIVQGKTDEPLILPIPMPVLQAVADYILNGRPDTDSKNVFIRHQAPFTGYHDGVSVACIFRKYQKKAGIAHTIGDGKTLHGIRRGLGTGMTASGIPVDVVAQVLGHKGTKATKQYISADLKSMHNCTLGVDSLGGGDNEPS